MNEVLQLAGGAGGTKAHYARVKRDLTGLVCGLATKAKLPKVQRARLSFRWLESHRRRDPDNIACGKKFVIDGLVRAGVLPGDGWDHVVSLSDTFEVGTLAGVEVTIEPVP